MDWELTGNLAVRLPDHPLTQLPNMLVDDLFQVVLLREADDRFDHLAAFENQNRRDAADLEFERDVRILVDIQFAHRDLARIFARQRVDSWGQPLARPA